MANQDNELVGVYGGSFDPVHLGHLLPCLEATKLLGISHLTLIPCYLSPLKHQTHSSPQARVDMLKLAIQQYPQLRLDLREVTRNQVTYTVDTLRELKQENPNQTLCFFMGMDSLQSFSKWHKWQEILTLTHLVVMKRGEYNGGQLNLCDELASRVTVQKKALKQQQCGVIYNANTVKLTISSSDIRDRIKRKESTSELLPDKVANYICQHGLYVEADAS